MRGKDENESMKDLSQMKNDRCDFDSSSSNNKFQYLCLRFDSLLKNI